jgi:hypothetical protein
VTLQGQALENRYNFQEFLQRVDLAETWIQEKVGAPLDREFGVWGQELKNWVGKSKVFGTLAL